MGVYNIVDASTGVSHTFGFLWDGSGFTTIDVPGAISTFVEGINDRGQVMGYYSVVENASTGTDQTFGFLWDGSGFTTITAPGATLYRPPRDQRPRPGRG